MVGKLADFILISFYSVGEKRQKIKSEREGVVIESYVKSEFTAH